MSERQQLAEAIRQALRNGTGVRVQNEGVAVNAVVPLLVAAERAGYERCKRDATTGIEAEIPEATGAYLVSDRESGYVIGQRHMGNRALAVVAALNATQQEAP